MGNAMLRLSARVRDWWATLSPRCQSFICAALMLALLAVGGAVEGTAPEGMYY